MQKKRKVLLIAVSTIGLLLACYMMSVSWAGLNPNEYCHKYWGNTPGYNMDCSKGGYCAMFMDSLMGEWCEDLDPEVDGDCHATKEKKTWNLEVYRCKPDNPPGTMYCDYSHVCWTEHRTKTVDGCAT